MRDDASKQSLMHQGVLEFRCPPAYAAGMRLRRRASGAASHFVCGPRAPQGAEALNAISALLISPTAMTGQRGDRLTDVVRPGRADGSALHRRGAECYGCHAQANV
jgi:hypothetical protein